MFLERDQITAYRISVAGKGDLRLNKQSLKKYKVINQEPIYLCGTCRILLQVKAP